MSLGTDVGGTENEDIAGVGAIYALKELCLFVGSHATSSGHTQRWYPGIFMQVALSLQICSPVRHSLMSKQKQSENYLKVLCFA